MPHGPSGAYRNVRFCDENTIPYGIRHDNNRPNVVLYDASGNPIDATTPLPVSDAALLTELQIKADPTEQQYVRVYGATGTSTFQVPRIDAATYTLQTIDYEHHETHGGSHYNNLWFISVPADDVLDIRLVMPDNTRWSHIAFDTVTEAEFHMSIYRGITVSTAGTALTAINSDHNSDNESNWTTFDYIINTSVANANLDTDITSATVIGQVATGSGRAVTGGLRRGNENILKQATGYCIRFENQTNAAKYVNWRFEWYEHTNKTA